MAGQVNVLVVGEGGREFAIAKKLQESPHVKQVYCAPGNVGMPTVGVQPVAIAETDFAGLIKFAKEHAVAWTFVGPEDCLVDGIVDDFAAAGLKAFGPNARAAQLEGSKDYALNFMNNYGVPTARHASYRDQTAALAEIDQFGFPLVIKENGLAGGKGVVIAQDHATAVQTVKEMFASGQARLVLEECLVGPEYSMFVLLSNGHYRILPMAQDHKRAYDGDKGPNTGGMGAYSPAPVLPDSEAERMADLVARPILRELAADGHPFVGILYAGLMMTADGPRVLEYNARFGDPECQPLLMRLEGDLPAVMLACVEGRLDPASLSYTPRTALGVVVAARGYPGSYPKGMPISGLSEADALPDVKVFHSGTSLKDGKIVSSGGRVLCVTALGDTLADARDAAYAALKKIDMPDSQYRSDIGQKGINRLAGKAGA